MTTAPDRSSETRANMPVERADGDDVNADGSPVVAEAFQWPDATPGDPGAYNSWSGTTAPRDADKKGKNDG